MENYKKLLFAIANKEIKWHLVNNENETKECILNLVDKLHENLVFSVLSDDEVEKLKVNDLNMLFVYDDCVMFLKKFLPNAEWQLMVDSPPQTTWNTIFNELELIYHELFMVITTKTEIDNNIKLDF